ncbi:MAG: hypothetical protein K6G85_09225 [Eubacterium sp.]|nr:hypothetical protein [Eubacterium sp.]
MLLVFQEKPSSENRKKSNLLLVFQEKTSSENRKKSNLLLEIKNRVVADIIKIGDSYGIKKTTHK